MRHVGAKSALLRFFSNRKTSARCLALPLTQKVALAAVKHTKSLSHSIRVAQTRYTSTAGNLKSRDINAFPFFCKTCHSPSSQYYTLRHCNSVSFSKPTYRSIVYRNRTVFADSRSIYILAGISALPCRQSGCFLFCIPIIKEDSLQRNILLRKSMHFAWKRYHCLQLL